MNSTGGNLGPKGTIFGIKPKPKSDRATTAIVLLLNKFFMISPPISIINIIYNNLLEIFFVTHD